MTPRKFIESKEIKRVDLKENFQFERRFEISMNNRNNHSSCLNCGDSINVERLASEYWTSCEYCRKCQRFILTLFGDRAGGGYSDIVEIYK